GPTDADPGPSPLTTGSTPLKAAAMTPGWRLPAPDRSLAEDTAPTDAALEDAAPHPFGEGSSGWRSGWASAPAYDDDHPDELAYRPFALVTLLTETVSFNDLALQPLVHPGAHEAIAMLDDEGVALPIRVSAGELETAMAWAQAFSGEAVNFEAMAPSPEGRVA